MLDFTVNGQHFSAEEGHNLLAFLRGQGIAIVSGCDGRGICGKCAVSFNGQTRLACQVTLGHDLTVLTDYQAAPDFEPRGGLGLAIDLGTTTIAMELIDLAAGKSIWKTGFENPQRAYGADVISRIAASKVHAAQLRELIRGAIAAHAPEGVTEAVIAGNATMIHLLLGLGCACLGAAPFEPVAVLRASYPWGELFGGDSDCPVFVVPWISAFVGGDIAAGLLNVPWDQSFLLVDLGTNGEIALCHEGEFFVTSAAAGPAFEGMKPGLYASDILDLTASLLASGQLDETGLLEGEAPLTQADIRQIQLAKSAVRTGVELLLDAAGRPEVETVYLCGGFGKELRDESALAIGLFPESARGRVVPLGNASLAGAARLLKNPGERGRLPAVLCARQVSLPGHPEFNRLFMEYIGFLYVLE